MSDAKNIAVVAAPGASFDVGAASLALYHLLSSLGKTVVPVRSDGFAPSLNELPGAGALKSDLGPKDLVITLDINETPIEKVSYRAEEGKFRLVVRPMNRNFAVENIHYDYQGLSYDLIFVLGAQKFDDLGELYRRNTADFSETTVINIDINPLNEMFGQINIVDFERKSLCELLFNLFLLWGDIPTKEAAQCLLAAFVRGSADKAEASSVGAPVVNQLQKGS